MHIKNSEMKRILFVFSIYFILQVTKCETDSEAIIRTVNSKNRSWKAGYNARFHNADDEFVRMHLGAQLLSDAELEEFGGRKWPQTDTDSLPDEFDLREQYPDCETIQEVRDQGACGSCWAIAAVEAMSDRYCIQLNLSLHLSTLDLLACCSDCGYGCNGGSPINAWRFWTKHGIVTGGVYNTTDGCKPYPIAMCSHHVEGRFPDCGSIVSTPECTSGCEEEYEIDYWDDKHFGENYYILPRNQTAIMMDIKARGSVEASYRVYNDFLTYKSGVYEHVTGVFRGGHAVKLIGWGTENGVDYWLAANSWNTDWGEDGFFKFRRGTNECGIENNIVAGLASK